MSVTPEDRHRKFLEINEREAAMANLVSRKNAEANLDIQPVVLENRSLDDELRDINEQRNQALNSLRKILRPEIAATFVSSLVDEQLIFLNETMPDFIKELRHFDSRKLSDVTVMNLFERWTESYNTTQGISILMQSGEVISLSRYDPAISRDLRKSLVDEGLADDEGARTFLAKLKGKDLADLEREKFIDYLIDYKNRLKAGAKLPSLTTMYKSYKYDGHKTKDRIEKRLAKMPSAIQARIDALLPSAGDPDVDAEIEELERQRDRADPSKRYEEWQGERALEHHEVGEDYRDYIVSRTDMLHAERNIETRQHRIEALRQALDVKRDNAQKREEALTQRIVALDDRITELSVPGPGGKKTPTKALTAIRRLEAEMLNARKQLKKNADDFERYEAGVDTDIAALTNEVRDLRDEVHNAQTFRESIVSKPRYRGDERELSRQRRSIARDLYQAPREISKAEAENVPGYSTDREDTPQDEGDERFGYGLQSRPPSVALGLTRKVPAPRRVKATATVKRQERRPVFATFGKHRIHIGNLEYGALDIRYPSGIKHATTPKQKISQQLQDVLINALRDGKGDARNARRLSLEDKRLLKRICDKADVESNIDIEEDDQEMERFELLRGEIMAGNDNPTIVKELRRFLLKFKSEGRISSQQASKVLMELAQLDI